MKQSLRSLLYSACAGLLISACQSPESVQAPASDAQARKAPTLNPLNAGVDNYVFNESALTSSGWTKTFEDDFNSTALDLNKWKIWTGGAYNNELQLYQSDNLTVSDGNLKIAAKAETKIGPQQPSSTTPKSFSFTSGRIECKTNVSASATNPRVRMCARIKIPNANGMWPAFWSYGDPWPTQGEIDIMEAKGNEPSNFSTNYFYGRRAGINLSGDNTKKITSSVSLTDYFHVYEVIWEKNTLTFLLDGQIVDPKTGGYIPNLFGKKERVTLNLAVGGDYLGNPPANTIVPGTMQVDWVKVFVSK